MEDVAVPVPAAGAAGALAAGGAEGTGSLIVGAAVGLGGRLMRTVSFFGCTLEASTVLGMTGATGGAPAAKFEAGDTLGVFGVSGVFSDINLKPRLRLKPECVKRIKRVEKGDIISTEIVP